MSFTTLPHLFVAPSLWHLIIYIGSMMVLATHITQVTEDHPLLFLQTWGNLSRLLWIIMPFIDGGIHHSFSLVHGPFIMTFYYIYWQHDGVDHPHHSDNRGSPFTTLTDLGKFAKGTVDYTAIYWWHHSPFLLTSSGSVFLGYVRRLDSLLLMAWYTLLYGLFALCQLFILLVRPCHFWLSDSLCVDHHVYCPISKINRSFTRLIHLWYII